MSSSFQNRTLDAFDQLTACLQTWASPHEGFTAYLQGEQTDFVRFNHGRIRQPGSVEQATLTLRWLNGRRHASVDLSLTGELQEDKAQLHATVETLRGWLACLPEDPHLRLPETVTSSDQWATEAAAPTAPMVQHIVDGSTALDLVGILANGTMVRCFSNHMGQRNTFCRSGAHFDYSLYDPEGRAIKASLAGDRLTRDDLQDAFARGKRQLDVLGRPKMSLNPGEYRSFLAPAALEELFSLLSWGSFSGREQATRQSGLMRLIDGATRFHTGLNLREDLTPGLAPAFQETGFPRPDVVPLIQGGQHVGGLVSPRTSAEHGLPGNGARAGESPTSLVLAGGDLPTAEAMPTLGTGLWVSNLWYLNWSDQAAGRVTGMTRFGTMWVEDGEPVAPIEHMRFDDTLERMLGSSLERLTTEQSLLPSTSTYGQRSTDSMTLPGALLSGFRLTL